MNLTPEIGQRGALVGRTGSGKTTTAIALLEAALYSYPVVIVDTKGVRAFEQLPGYIYEDSGDLLGALDDDPTGKYAYIYRPEGEDNEARSLDHFLQRVYDSRISMYVYIDETYQVVEGTTKPARGLANLIMRGRYRETTDSPVPVEVTVICGTQRPSWVPKIIFTEADHFYIHSLSNYDDLHLMASYTDPLIQDEPAGAQIPEISPEITKHDFYYYNIADQLPELAHVNLEDERAA